MRDAIEQLPASRIREVANAGLGRSDVLAFWFGESDEFTRKAVRQAASESLLGGETFYSQPRPGRVARGLVGVHDGAAPSGGARAHRGHRVGRVGADAGDADAGQCRERGRGRGAGGAQPDRAARDPRRKGDARAAGVQRRRVDARPRPSAGRDHTRDGRAARQRPQQPDRLDADVGRAAGAARPMPSHRHLDRRRRGPRADLVRRRTARRRTARRRAATSRASTPGARQGPPLVPWWRKRRRAAGTIVRAELPGQRRR